MDIQMPVMNGYEAIQKIRAMGFTNEDLPVVALTAYALDDDKFKVIESGMNDYIAKPIDPNVLYKTVIKNIRSKSKLEEDFLPTKDKEKEEVINLSALVKSFKDDPAFVTDYLKTFEREFTELPLEAIKLSKQRDVNALTNLIHKLNPSIRRFEKTDLPAQLNTLKDLITRKDSNVADIEQAVDDIQESCDELLESIYTLKLEYA